MISIIVNIVASVWRAYAVAVLWAWFAVPYLNLPPLTMGPLYGLLLVWSLFALRSIDPAIIALEGEEKTKYLIINNTFHLLVPGLSLLAGWIVKHFI